ncbi:hypothetical protein Nizo2264_0430 [Lactiplantibacillus plantarum]|nr:hypothetical protein Nizo2264_0430 [Lactiplantibacillus plantarum]
MSQTASITGFFKDFLVRRIMIDHTFTFPRMIWTFATIVLIAFGYSTVVVGLSYILIYGLYVLVDAINFISVGILLKPYPKEQQFYLHLWWLTLTLPLYMFLTAWIRLIGVINAMTTQAAWKMRGFTEEWQRVWAVLHDDAHTIRQHYRQRRKGK